MGSLGPAESSCTSMPSPRQDDFMAARVQSGAPPTAAISAMAPSQAPVCRVHEMKLSTWLECMSHTSVVTQAILFIAYHPLTKRKHRFTRLGVFRLHTPPDRATPPRRSIVIRYAGGSSNGTIEDDQRRDGAPIIAF